MATARPRGGCGVVTWS